MRRRVRCLFFGCLLVPAFASSQPPGREKAAEWANRNYKPKRTSDPFTKASTTNIELPHDRNRIVKCNHTTGLTFATMELMRQVKPEGEPMAVLKVTYIGRQWLFLDEELPLQLLLGDSLVTMTHIQEPVRQSTTMAAEVGVFPVTAESLVRIADAPAVRVRLQGKQGNCDWTLKPEAQEMMRVFALREMSATPAAP